MAQQPAGPPVHEVQSSTGWTGDALIFAFWHVIVVEPVLDLHQYRRAGEQDLSHPKKYDGAETPDHDVAQGQPMEPSN